MDITRLFDLKGKAAVVTGASRGIGLMIAEGLLSAGVTTYICARKEKELNEAYGQLAKLGRCEAVVADISTPEGTAKISAAVAAKEKALHILVNNAGATWAAPLDAFPRSGFDKVLATNITAPFMLIQALLPLLRAAATADDPSRIINISSTSGIKPPARESYPYSASKAGLNMLTWHLSETLAAQNITVNAIAPGVFPSRMTEFMFDPTHPHYKPMPEVRLGNRPGRIEDIAGTVIYLASRAGGYVTGVTLQVSGGYA